MYSARTVLNGYIILFMHIFDYIFCMLILIIKHTQIETVHQLIFHISLQFAFFPSLIHCAASYLVWNTMTRSTCLASQPQE